MVDERFIKMCAEQNITYTQRDNVFAFSNFKGMIKAIQVCQDLCLSYKVEGGGKKEVILK